MTETEILALWHERAAIREYDGGMTRDRAEYQALRDVRKIIGELPE